MHEWLCCWACALRWSCNKGDGWRLLFTSDLHHLYCCHKAAMGTIINHFFFSSFSLLQITLFQKTAKLFSPFSPLKPIRHGWEKKGDWSLTHATFFWPPSAAIDPPPHGDPLFFPNVPRLYVSFSLFLPFYCISLSLVLPPQCDGFMLQCTFRLCVGWCCGLASGSF